MACMKSMHRGSIYKGSDIRISTGFAYNPKIWPRQSIDPRRWTWKVAVGYPLTMGHINLQELHAALISLKWRLRNKASVHKRFIHLMDSFVCLAILCKGRTSSQLMMRILKQVNALV